MKPSNHLFALFTFLYHFIVNKYPHSYLSVNLTEEISYFLRSKASLGFSFVKNQMYLSVINKYKCFVELFICCHY